MSPITQGLYMTGIGMGLVFIAILALWFLMDLLVKLTNDRPKKNRNAGISVAVVEETLESVDETAAIVAGNDKTKMHKAAAAAVAIALGLNQRTGKTTLQEKGVISPWLTTRRTNILSQSAALLNRKNRGSAR